MAMSFKICDTIQKNLCILGAFGFLCFITFVLFLPSCLDKWPYSLYFSLDGNSPELVKTVLTKNRENLLKSREHLMSLSEKSYDFKNGSEIAIGIITMKRSGSAHDAGYLTQTTSHLLREVNRNLHSSSDATKTKVVPFLCNIDANSLLHKEALDLEDRINIAVKYHAVPNDMEMFDKEKTDYSFCLLSALKYKPKYVILLEDDVLAVQNFFGILKTKLDHILASHDNADDWLFMKMYYPQKWQGFGHNVYHYMELIGIAIFGGFGAVVLQFCFAYFCRKKHKLSPRKTSIFGLYFILGAIYCVLLAVSVGRPYLLQLRTFSSHTYDLISAPGCCTQAVLYPASKAEKIAQHLNTITATHMFGVDLIIDRYALDNGLYSYLIEPSLVKHIGMVSSLKRKSKPASEFL